MARFERDLRPQLLRAARGFPAVVLTGPRRAGKTYLLRDAFPKATYVLLEDPDIIARIRADTRGWLLELQLPAILDEIQNVPEILPYIRTLIDQAPSRRGRWLLTGSQDFTLMRGVSESMAGRAAIFHLLPLSVREMGKWDLLLGGFPEAVLRPRSAGDWFRSYLQTYIERDVRALLSVRDVATFRRFLALLATRQGQLLNKTDLAAPLGVSVPTIASWIDVLETTGHLLLVPPFYENLGKRLIKSPKLYWVDSGLVAHLLGFETRRAIEKSPFIGPLFEGFVASEIAKLQVNSGRRRDIYHFRDQQGLEVDFVLPAPNGELHLVEAKWTRTVTPAMARPIETLRGALVRRRTRGFIVTPAIPAASRAIPRQVAAGVHVTTVDEYFSGP